MTTDEFLKLKVGNTLQYVAGSKFGTPDLLINWIETEYKKVDDEMVEQNWTVYSKGGLSLRITDPWLKDVIKLEKGA